MKAETINPDTELKIPEVIIDEETDTEHIICKRNCSNCGGEFSTYVSKHLSERLQETEVEKAKQEKQCPNCRQC